MAVSEAVRRATLRNSELAERVAQCVVDGTASQDEALWHNEPRVITQKVVNRDKCRLLTFSCTKM